MHHYCNVYVLGGGDLSKHWIALEWVQWFTFVVNEEEERERERGKERRGWILKSDWCFPSLFMVSPLFSSLQPSFPPSLSSLTPSSSPPSHVPCSTGTKIVSSREFCPLNFRITSRNLSGMWGWKWRWLCKPSSVNRQKCDFLSEVLCYW